MSTLLALLLSVLQLACQGSGNPVMEQYFDLGQLAKQQGLLEKKRLEILVWTLDGDQRKVLYQPPPGSVELGPFPEMKHCSLRFGIGIKENAIDKSDGVGFQVYLDQDGRRELLFSHLLEPGDLRPASWSDFTVAIPSSSHAPFSLVLETDVGPSGEGSWDLPAWSAPHLVCEGTAARSAARDPDLPDIILISLDTLRADRLGVYGYDRPITPNLDAFAQECLVFEHAFATAPYTLPSHASMLTGLYPEQHTAGHGDPVAPLPETATTVAEILAATGYRTAALTAGGVMSSTMGFAQGFEHWSEHQRANLGSMLPAVLEELAAAGEQPLFLFLHTYDIHGPYQQPVGHRTFLRESYPAKPQDDQVWQRILSVPCHDYLKLERFSCLQQLRDAYDSGVHFVDSELAPILDYLRRSGIADNAVIIVTSDHGESLYEHGRYLGHTYSLYDQEVRVPLLLRLPSGQPGRRRDLTSLVDLVPTMLAFAGVAAPADLAGRDLLDATVPAPEAIHGETSFASARYLRTQSWKLIAQRPDPGWESRKAKVFGEIASRFETGRQLFSCNEDPAETHNLLDDPSRHPEQVQALAQTIWAEKPDDSRLDVDDPVERLRSSHDPDEELLQQLEALGYLHLR